MFIWGLSLYKYCTNFLGPEIRGRMSITILKSGISGVLQQMNGKRMRLNKCPQHIAEVYANIC